MKKDGRECVFCKNDKEYSFGLIFLNERILRHKKNNYVPKPADAADVVLFHEILELAENTYEVWTLETLRLIAKLGFEISLS